MKKIFDKKTIFTILITMMICFGGIVIASKLYHATDVSYSPMNSNWEVTNVNDALDSLYDLTSSYGTSKIINLGTGTSFDVSSYNGYEKFTTDNFIVGVANSASATGTEQKLWGDATNASCQGSVSGFSLAKSYDPTTGILTISGNKLSGNGRLGFDSQYSTSTASVTMTPFAYLIIGDIE